MLLLFANLMKMHNFFSYTCTCLYCNYSFTRTGQTFIATDSEYSFECCGVVKKWKALFSAEGYIRFQGLAKGSQEKNQDLRAYWPKSLHSKKR